MFKICPTCSHTWPTIESFLNDPELRLAGYQAHFENLVGGLFIFTHATETCGTSLAIPVKKFVSLTDRPILSAQTKQTEGCPGKCMREGCLASCPIECECSWVREILRTIETWPRPVV